MATKYGFNITIGADTKPFELALKKLNAPIKEAQTNLKRISEGLKLNPTNVALLGTKQEELASKIADTKAKISGLQEALRNLNKEYQANGSYTKEQEVTYRKLIAEIATSQEELKQLEKEYGQFGSVGLQVVSAVGSKMQDLGNKIADVGKKLMPISLMAGGALTAMAKSASNWEDAWVGVTKTVDGTEEQMSKLEQDLMNMAVATGVSKDELAEFAEALGQSGVQVDNIKEMTRVISDLNVATNIVGEEGARQLAQLFNIMKLNTNESRNFGSALTALGNEFPTTEKDILDLATNMASTGDIVGLTGQQLLALSTALTSLGAETEAGGTAMTKMFKNIQRAVASGGDQLEKFANVSQMSVEDFSELFRTDALGALRAFTKGLADMQDNGGDVILTLDDLKLSEVRLSNQLLKLVSNTGVLDKALEISNQSWEDNYALAEEADKRYGTLTYRMQALKEQVDNITVSLGNILLPILKNVIARVQEWIAKFEQLSPQTRETIVKVLLLTTVLAPLIILVSKVIGGIGTILVLLPKIVYGITSLFGVVKVVVAGIGGLLKGLFALIMAHPVIAVATVIIGALILLYNKCEWFRNGVNNILKAVWNFFANLGTNLKTFFTQTIPNLVAKGIQFFQELPYKIGYFIGQVLAHLVNFGVAALKWCITNVPKIINGIITFFASLPGNLWNILLSALSKVGDFLSNMWNTITSRLPGIVQSIVDWFNSIDLWEVGWNIIEGLWNGISNARDWLWSKIKGFAQGILNGFKDSLDISSPSKVFEDVIGKNIALGIGEGFDNNIGNITKDMVGQINGITSDINVAGTGTVTLQFYPQQMTEADLEMAFNYVNRRFGTQY